MCVSMRDVVMSKQCMIYYELNKSAPLAVRPSLSRRVSVRAEQVQVKRESRRVEMGEPPSSVSAAFKGRENCSHSLSVAAAWLAISPSPFRIFQTSEIDRAMSATKCRARV